MAELIYVINCSLDGYIEDKSGKFDWTQPNEEQHWFINDLVRGASTLLYGRRMYETMAVWETEPSLADQSAFTRDFAEMWRAADKVVFSRTLDTVATTRTRLEHIFDPQAIRDLKASATSDILIGGPNLASYAFKAGLVDQCHLFLAPIIVGGGKRALPNDVRLKLELDKERRFGNGVVYVGYRVKA